MKSNKHIGIRAKSDNQDRVRSAGGIAALSQLPTLTTTELKTQCWAAVIAQINKVPAMAVTHHHKTDIVILAASEYESLVQQAGKNAFHPTAGESQGGRDPVLAKLQQEFDQRLAKLKDRKSLDAITRLPAHRGKIRLGSIF